MRMNYFWTHHHKCYLKLSDMGGGLHKALEAVTDSVNTRVGCGRMRRPSSSRDCALCSPCSWALTGVQLSPQENVGRSQEED